MSICLYLNKSVSFHSISTSCVLLPCIKILVSSADVIVSVVSARLVGSEMHVPRLA